MFTNFGALNRYEIYSTETRGEVENLVVHSMKIMKTTEFNKSL